MISLNKIRNYLWMLIFLFMGMIIILFPMLFISWDLMPGDLGDGRFINYLFEHSFLFVNNIHPHTSFWDFPIFYPAKNAISLSDFMLGGMFIYIPIRFFVKSPQTSLQIWLIIACLLNYLSMYFMLKILKFKDLSASLGAFLFAFCLPRNIQICHLQLYTQFYTIFSFIAFLCINKNNTKLKNHILCFVGCSLFVIQLYTSYYLGWFIIFGLSIFCVLSLFYMDQRSKLFKFIFEYKKELIIYSIVILIMMIPFGLHYLAVDIKLGWSDIFCIKWYSFLTSDSLLDSLILKNKFPFELETHIGIGIITGILVIAGIIKNKKYRKFIIPFVVLCLLFFGEKHLYHMLFQYFPGASAIRAAGRVLFLILPIFSISIAFLCQEMKNKILVCLVCCIVVIEQIPNTIYYEWTKTEHNKRLQEYVVPKECKVIAYRVNAVPNWKINNDIMWVGIRDKVYTVNGYSGYSPEYDYSQATEQCTFTIDEELPVKNTVIDVQHRETIY